MSLLTLAAVRTYLLPLNMVEGDQHRMACPACGGLNTFSVQKREGSLRYTCYRASCTIGGLHTVGMTTQDIKKRLDKVDKVCYTFDVPSTWTSILNNKEAMNFLKSVNSLKAYEKGLADVRYDPKERRVVFLVKDDKGNVVDATGRSLDSKVVPKWKRYANSDWPFICGNSDICFLVEDAPSACAIAATGVGTGLSILGTNVTHEHMLHLRNYKQIFIALDPDAAVKALSISRQMRYIGCARVVLIPDDLKYYDELKLKVMLTEWIRPASN